MFGINVKSDKINCNVMFLIHFRHYVLYENIKLELKFPDYFKIIATLNLLNILEIISCLYS